MERRALVALAISRKTTNACPLIFSVLRATMSMMGPNWEKMAYRDFFSSGGCVCVSGQHAHSLRTACSQSGQHAHSFRTICSQSQDSMLTVSGQHAHSFRTACSQFQDNMLTVSRQHAQSQDSMLTVSGQHAHSFRTACSVSGQHAQFSGQHAQFQDSMLTVSGQHPHSFRTACSQFQDILYCKTHPPSSLSR